MKHLVEISNRRQFWERLEKLYAYNQKSLHCSLKKHFKKALSLAVQISRYFIEDPKLYKYSEELGTYQEVTLREERSQNVPPPRMF